MNDFSVAPKHQKMLLGLARAAIARHIAGEKGSLPLPDDPFLSEPAAVFVTLTTDGRLRGCIGTTEPSEGLAVAVRRMAVAAATEDYRFSPVTAAELRDIHIEISVLSPMKRVSSPDEIREGVHGVVVRRGARGGLFLPQVWEHFSTKKEFMDELCSQKTGLAPDAWTSPGTDLYIFTVFAFEEPR